MPEINDESTDCPEMCSKCDSQKRCTQCNKSKNYYPIELTSQINPLGTVECITEDIRQSQYPKFYFDLDEKSFKTCYYSCARCYGKGDQNFNNCTTCISGYIFHPDYENSKDCVLRPNNDYYYIKNGKFTLTDAKKCPDDYHFLIEEKGKCIDICKNENRYKYAYDELCYENPPENTNDNDGDFICKDNPNTCIATRKILYTSADIITEEEIEELTSKYAKQYDYTNNHISIYENDFYIIVIYKNGHCISQTGIISKIIDFGNCYNKIQTKNSINLDTSLMIVYIETKPGSKAYKKYPTYGLFHPETGESLNYEEECKNENIVIQKNITKELNNSKVSVDDIQKMAENGLDLFDPKCPFYNDLCTHYPDI